MLRHLLWSFPAQLSLVYRDRDSVFHGRVWRWRICHSAILTDPESRDVADRADYSRRIAARERIHRQRGHGYLLRMRPWRLRPFGPLDPEQRDQGNGLRIHISVFPAGKFCLVNVVDTKVECWVLRVHVTRLAEPSVSKMSRILLPGVESPRWRWWNLYD